MAPWLLITAAVLASDADGGEPASDAGEVLEVDAGELDGGEDAGEPEPVEESTGSELGEEETPPEVPVEPEPLWRAPLQVTAVHAIAGRFTSTRCMEPTQSVLEKVSARLAGGPKNTIVLDTGDMLGASALGRFATDQSPEKVAQVIAKLGFAARSLGHRDLAAPREALLAFTRALKEAGVPTALTNLKCDEQHHALCDVVASNEAGPLILLTPRGSVAFISAMSPALLESVSKELSGGLSLTAPAEAISRATRFAREAGASWVVAVFDPSVGSEADETLALVRALDPKARPDLLLVHGLYDTLRTATAGNAMVPLVATQPGDALTATVNPDGTVLSDSAVPGEPDPAVVEYARELNLEVCRRYQSPYPRGGLGRELTRDEMAALVVSVMREYARAEVAFINKPALSTTAPWPLDPPLTALSLLQALPYENRLRVMTIPGGALQEFLDSPRAKQHYVRGAEKKDGWKINGRPLEPAQSYRIVTTDFVADNLGGAFEGSREYGTLMLREVVARWLSHPQLGELLDQPIDPAERVRWWLNFRVQLDLTSVSVRNPAQAIFTDTQLARGQSLAAVGETEVRAIGDHPSYVLEHLARLRFGLVSSTALDGTSSGVVNNVDVITARTTAFARRLFGTGKWYQPRPYSDFFIESELTRPDTRPYHHLQLLPTAGLRFELFPQFAVYAGGGVTWEVFARREDLNPQVPPAAAVFVAGWQLRPWRIVQVGARWIEAETSLDFWVRDLLGPTQSQARARFRLVVPLFSVLSLTATYDLFFRSVRLQDPGAGWFTLFGSSHDAYLGLQVAFGQSYQSFAF